MADWDDIHTNPKTFNYEWTQDIREATSNYDLTDDQFNAVKHAGVSAVTADVMGRPTANILGALNEWAQDAIAAWNGNPNVSDDMRDFMNNEIGREFAARNPGLTAEQYYQAMAELAKRGNLVTDPNFSYPEFPNGVQGARPFIDYLNAILDHVLDPNTTNAFETFNIHNYDYCFLSCTPIQMWPLDPLVKPRADGTYDEQMVLSKVWEKPISAIEAGDVVVSYDAQGRLVPGYVPRTFENRATHILDFWNTGVTPGHAYYCADGPFKGQHVPLLDILRSDGAIMLADGRVIRAATGCELGTPGDRFVQAATGEMQPNGEVRPRAQGLIRLGTRLLTETGHDMSVMELIAVNGGTVTEDGYIQAHAGAPKTPFWWKTSDQLPKPEDYILARSDVTLEAIYAAGEWEQIGTRLPAPVGRAGRNAAQTSQRIQPTTPAPNLPMAFADHPDAPRTGKAQTAFRHKVAKAVH